MASYYLQAQGAQKVSEPFFPLLVQSTSSLANVITQFTWSPIVYKDNYRLQANFIESYFCAFDIDNKFEMYSLDQAINDYSDCECIIGLTKSHQKPKNIEPPKDRFRVIIPWENPITNLADYVATMRKWAERKPYIDKSCVDGARLFYPCTKIVMINLAGFRQESFSNENDSVQTPLDSISPPNASKMIPYHVKKFLEHGTIFGEGRQRSCYLSALHLFESGSDLANVKKLLHAAPFYRKDFSNYEIDQAVNNAAKKFGLIKK